jgi:hypothetical protein
MNARNTTPVACGHANRVPGCNECEPNPYTRISLPTLQVCAAALNARIETAEVMLAAYCKLPGATSWKVMRVYIIGRERAIAQLDDLHSELESRIATLVNL